MKFFDTDLILDSFQPLKELTQMNGQAMNIRITKKLQQLADLLRHTEKKQLTARQLEKKRQDFHI